MKTTVGNETSVYGRAMRYILLSSLSLFRKRSAWLHVFLVLFFWMITLTMLLWYISDENTIDSLPENMQKDAQFKDFILSKAESDKDIDLFLAAQELSHKLKFDVSLSDKAKKVLVDKTCKLWDNSTKAYPQCHEKVLWMKNGWKTHYCYAAHGVDGSLCSFLIYLSEVEHHCPVLPWRTLSPVPPKQFAEFQTNVENLFKLMNDNDINYDFIKKRIRRMWPKWINAFKENAQKWPKTMENRELLNIFIYMGFLSKETGFKFGEKSSSGGPLGELVQWSDLIAALYVLGHNLSISTESTNFKEIMEKLNENTPCPGEISAPKVSLIFTDIVGLRFMRRKMSIFFQRKKCQFRVLDSFGTHAEFNDGRYFKSKKKAMGWTTNPWGGFALNLQQFMTLYPHTDDNTFLGFVVELNEVSTFVKRENFTLVYGKEIYMWKDAIPMLKTVQRLSPLHANVADVRNLSNYENFSMYNITNHGLLSPAEFHALLRRAKIFLGLGFPFEGPAPLEAIANGAVYINPKFVKPKSRMTYKFFADKPTLRELTSQNPYLEQFVGPPQVLTVDITNQTAVEDAVRFALTVKATPYLPFEFTASGMLQRVNVLIKNQDFCQVSNFPPASSLTVVLGENGLSCQDACRRRDRLCEQSFFPLINSNWNITRQQCSELVLAVDPTAPHDCIIQQEPLLFSCASVPDPAIRRICPCRSYLKNQTALCAECLL